MYGYYKMGEAKVMSFLPQTLYDVISSTILILVSFDWMISVFSSLILSLSFFV